MARAIGPRSIRGCRGGATLIGMLRSPVWPVLSVPACWSCRFIWVSAFCMGWMVLSGGFPPAPHSFSRVDG